jgi:hypothetical protein
MSESKKEIAADCRRRAAQCTEIGERLSVRVAREQMLALAKKWLSLVENAERNTDSETRGLSCRPRPTNKRPSRNVLRYLALPVQRNL